MGCCDQPTSSSSTTKQGEACCGPAVDPRIGVRERYAAIARQADAGNHEPAISEGGCCGGSAELDRRSLGVGYSTDDLSDVPREADMGLGCGNPTALAGLHPGEVVLDLGSGGGIDCFLAAKRVGEEGRVIGVDMTPEMIMKSRANADKLGHHNVEFRLGEIEHLPVADGTVDVVISNCVINLSPDKAQVYAEVARILKPGGRFCVSDVLAREELSDEVRQDVALRSCCIGGAETIERTQKALAAAGFTDISITPKDESADYIKDWGHHAEAARMVVSCDILAHRPA